jgi:tRNA(Ile)-lysidine synthase
MTFSAASLHAVLNAEVPLPACGLVVAVSGGADSAALLAATVLALKDFRALTLRAVHIDHGLQAAAAEFRLACESWCDRLGVPLTIIQVAVDTPAGASIEAAARDVRYAALAAELKPRECLLTAHHREDQAETLLLQALRGAGIKGMAAMPVCRVFGSGWHLRPVLDVAQSELLDWGANLAGSAVNDPMNEDLRFDRSYVRKLIWPLLSQRWPGAGTALARTARHMAQAQQLLDGAARTDVARLRDGDSLQVRGLRALPALNRSNAVRHWIHEAGAEAPSAARLEEALRQVLSADADHLPAIVWGECALRRYRQRLFLTAARPPRMPATLAWSLAPPQSALDLGQELGRLSVVPLRGGLAADRLPSHVTVRRRGGGEALKPAAAAKTQSVQHLFQSLGVLPWMRDALPLVFAGDDLIAVADLWLDARWCAPADRGGLGLQWNKAPIIV